MLRIPVEEIERFENESGATPETPRLSGIVKRHFYSTDSETDAHARSV